MTITLNVHGADIVLKTETGDRRQPVANERIRCEQCGYAFRWTPPKMQVCNCFTGCWVILAVP